MTGQVNKHGASMTSVQPVLSIPIIPADVDLVSRVEAARRAKGNSPFVGIATGIRTIMLLRSRLKATLKGLRIINAEFAETHYSPITGPWDQVLVVHAVSENGRVKARRVFVPEKTWKHSPLLETWQRANLRKMGQCDCLDFYRRKTCHHVETATRPKENKHQKAIRKLEKEIPREWTPENPAVPKYRSEPVSADTRRHWRTWKLQKDARRAVMALARRGTKDLSSSKMYAELAKLTAPHFQMMNWDAVFNGPRGDDRPEPIYTLAVEPITVKKWGELNTHDREKAGGDLFNYLKVLWQFCGLASKPRRDHSEPTWGREHYHEWLTDLHTRKQLKEQIAAIKAEERACQ